MILPLCGSCKRGLENLYRNLHHSDELDAKSSILFHGRYINDEWCSDNECLKRFIEKLASDEETSNAE